MHTLLKGGRYVVGRTSAINAVVVFCNSRAVRTSTRELKSRKDTTMVSITQTVQYLVKEHSRKIHTIKMEAITRQTLEKLVYVSSDGKSQSDEQPEKDALANGWKIEKVTYEKIVGHISPAHPSWPKYHAMRRHASVLLTARLLLKEGRGEPPALSSVRAALSEGRLAHHARRGRARGLCYRALRYLRKLNNRLQRAPQLLKESLPGFRFPHGRYGVDMRRAARGRPARDYKADTS